MTPPRYYILKIFALGGMLAVRSVLGANLITNGDFSNGTNGFTSDYTYVTGANSAFPEGTYSVVTKANDVHNSWGAYYDHTSGNSSGKYFVANGASDTTKAVWESSAINVSQANTAYRFEAYIMAIYPSENNYPILSFQIGNGSNWTSLGTTATLNSRGSWLFTYADGQFASSGTYYLRLLNQNGASGGNDLGLDDIYFGFRSSAPSVGTTPGAATPTTFNPVSVVPEPSTYVLLALGTLGLVVVTRRRKA